MIITSTSSLEGYKIEKYLDIIIINKAINIVDFSEWLIGIQNSEAALSGMERLKYDVMKTLIETANEKKANAILGFSMDYDEIGGKSGGMLMVSVIGTPVKISRITETSEIPLNHIDMEEMVDKDNVVKGNKYIGKIDFIKEKYPKINNFVLKSHKNASDIKEFIFQITKLLNKESNNRIPFLQISKETKYIIDINDINTEIFDSIKDKEYFDSFLDNIINILDNITDEEVKVLFPYAENGYDRFGYNKDGYDIDGYDKDGYNKEGYDINGIYYLNFKGERIKKGSTCDPERWL